MFDDDMILARKEPEQRRQDAFARLFASVILAVFAASVAEALIRAFSGPDYSDAMRNLASGLRSGVFAGVLMLQPVDAVIERHSISRMLACFCSGFLLGLALQFFILTPSEGAGAAILAYFVLCLVIGAVWLIGYISAVITTWLGLPLPGDIWRAALQKLRKPRVSDPDQSDQAP